jgi:hypothetical protein
MNMKFLSFEHLAAILFTAFFSFMIYWKYELHVADIVLCYLGSLALFTAEKALHKVESK